MSTRRERVSPTGPANGTKLLVGVTHPPIAAQATQAASATLPAKSAQVGDSVNVNPLGALPQGVVIASARISNVDELEITLGNITAAQVDGLAFSYDVLIRRI
jgi:hypothetical protein